MPNSPAMSMDTCRGQAQRGSSPQSAAAPARSPQWPAGYPWQIAQVPPRLPLPRFAALPRRAARPVPSSAPNLSRPQAPRPRRAACPREGRCRVPGLQLPACPPVRLLSAPHRAPRARCEFLLAARWKFLHLEACNVDQNLRVRESLQPAPGPSS
jgi:hypothetical protein